MDKMIARFPSQLLEAIEIGQKAVINAPANPINKVYAAGLGGSGIGATFVAEFVREHCPVPYLVGKGYDIPAYLDKNTLAIASSYSGNTEETLNSFEQMLKTEAKIVVISSGGKLIEKAKQHGLDYIQLPDDWSSPRACLGYSLVQQMFVLLKLGFIEQNLIDLIKKSSVYLQENQTAVQNKAQRLASFLLGKIPVIYAADQMEAVAIRFRQQINENAKQLCWHHVVPEMNHNELVGWRSRYEDIAVIFLRNEGDYERNKVRMDINKEIINNYTDSVLELYSEGKSPIENSLYYVHLVDWTSYHLAVLKGVDPIEIKVIDYLKAELAKQ